MKETISQILKRIDDAVEQPMVTAKFGDNWKEHQRKMYVENQLDTNDMIRIAWINGRKSILLQYELQSLFSFHESIVHFLNVRLRSLRDEYDKIHLANPQITSTYPSVVNLFDNGMVVQIKSEINFIEKLIASNTPK